MRYRLQAMALVLCVAFVTTGGYALPRFAARTGAKCQSCHINPTGSGMRMAYGAQYGREQLPVPKWSKDFEVEDFTTLLTNILGVGADVRTLYYYRQVPGGVAGDSSNNAFWEMQGDLYLNLRLARKVNIYLDKGLYSGFEIFGMLQVLPANGYVKVGKFVPGYGTRVDDHTSFIRTMTGFSPELERPEHTGLEAAVNPGPVTLLGGLYNATEGFGLSGSSKSWLGRAEFRTKLSEEFTLGLGGNVFATRISADVKKTLYGGFGAISFSDATILGEVDFIATRRPAVTTTAMALYVEAAYPIIAGLDLKLAYDFGDTDIDIKAGSMARYSFGFEFFPIQGVEIRPMYRINKESPNDSANNQFDLLLHFYLEGGHDMKSLYAGVGVILLIAGAAALAWTTAPQSNEQGKAEPSYADDVFPIIRKNCLPCHAEDNFNPSGLVLDDFDKMMEGGEHGAPVSPGKAEESLLVKKLLADPPFGNRMPVDKKKKKGEKSTKQLPEEEIRIISEWIDQGARNN